MSACHPDGANLGETQAGSLCHGLTQTQAGSLRHGLTETRAGSLRHGLTETQAGSLRHGLTQTQAGSLCHGLTLVEVVAALSITAVVLLGTLSAVTLATRAIPNEQNNTMIVLKTAGVLDMLTADLHYATSITEATATAVTFAVADRNGDGSPETIRYAWSGVAGESLTRTYNNGQEATIVDHVQELALAFDKCPESDGLAVVRCTLRAGGDCSTRLTTAVRVLNEPEMTSDEEN